MSPIMEQYMAEAREEGKLKMVIELVKDGILSAEDAAARVGMSVEEFKTLLEHAE